jgi:hypothetical protein
MIHFDLDPHGSRFPIQPNNGKDYFGVDIRGKVNGVPLHEALMDSRNVGLAGREWARSNYRPLSIAQRFLNLIF